MLHIFRLITVFILLPFGLLSAQDASLVENPVEKLVQDEALDGFDELTSLIKAGVADDTIKAFIEVSRYPFSFDAEEILYLHDLGLSDKLIALAMRHGEKMREERRKADAQDELALQVIAEPLEVSVDEHLVAGAALRHRHPEATVQPQSDTVPALVQPQPDQAASPTVQPVYTATAVTSVRQAVSPAVVAPPQERLNISFFYEALYPYGTWIRIDNHSVFQPVVAQRDPYWRPYLTNGRWIYTEYGWTWQSGYSWGWAVFHYGRWQMHPAYGWVWYPDTVWGPAWVHWRRTPTHYGWAPLPPEARYRVGVGFTFRQGPVTLGFSFGLGARDYAFVPAHGFLDPQPSRYVVSRSNVERIYQNATVVENTYIYNDNRVFHSGLPVEEVQRETKREIRRARLLDEAYRPGERIRGARIEGEDYRLFRPSVREEETESAQEVIHRRETSRRQARENSPVRIGRETERERMSRIVSERERQSESARAEAQRLREAEHQAERESKRLQSEARRTQDSRQEELRAAASAEERRASQMRQQRHEAEAREAARQREALAAQQRAARRAEEQRRESALRAWTERVAAEEAARRHRSRQETERREAQEQARRVQETQRRQREAAEREAQARRNAARQEQQRQQQESRRRRDTEERQRREIREQEERQRQGRQRFEQQQRRQGGPLERQSRRERQEQERQQRRAQEAEQRQQRSRGREEPQQRRQPQQQRQTSEIQTEDQSRRRNR